MYFSFRCQKCEKKIKVRQEHAGRRVRCPYCQATNQVPEPPREESSTQLPQIRVDGPASTSAPAASGAASTLPSGGDTSVAPPPQPSLQVSNSGSNVPLFSSGVLGAVVAAIFYAAMIPLAGTYLGDLFLARGWVPFVLVFLTGWSFTILAMKSRQVWRQKDSMLYDLLPNETGDEINPRNVDSFIGHIRQLPARAGRSFLVTRVLRGLEHFAVRRNNTEVATMLASQSEIDNNSVESSYRTVKVFIWAIPILGFIGTVLGISDAVGGFAGSLTDAQDIEVLKESLNSVTGGLAVAFDTTLIALVMSLLVMFPASSLQKSEEDLLNWVDEYCNENLLKRLNDGGVNHREDQLPSGEALRKAIHAALAPHHAELETWSKKIDTVADRLVDRTAKGLKELGDGAATRQQELQALVDRTTEALAGMQAQVGQLQAQQLDDYRRELAHAREQSLAVQQEFQQQMAACGQSWNTTIVGLQQGLMALNSVLEQLGERQVTIQQIPPQRAGWFGFGLGRRNGK